MFSKKAVIIPVFFFNYFIYAAEIPQDAKPLELNDFSGGLATTVDTSKLDNKYSPDMKNVFIHRKPGKLVQRKGFITIGSTIALQDGRFGFTFNKENGDKEFIVSDSSMVLKTKDFQTYTFISSGLTTTTGLDCVQVRNKVWCTNGVDSVFTWDGTNKQILNGTLGLPNVPKGRYIDYWQERVWLLNTSADASSLQWSAIVTTAAEILAPDDPRAWPATHELFVGRGDGEVGTALWVQNGRLFVGKERSIWRMLGDDDTSYSPDEVDSQVGVISNDSVAGLDGLYYFKGLDGTYEFNGSMSRRLTDGIVPDMEIVDNVIESGVSISWDSVGDFQRGYTTFGTTIGGAGFVLPISTTNDEGANFASGISPDVEFPATPFLYFSNSGPNIAISAIYTPTTTFPTDTLYVVDYMELWGRCHTGGCSVPGNDVKYNVKVQNERTGKSDVVVAADVDFPGGAFTKIKWDSQQFLYGNQAVFLGSDLNNGNFRVTVETAGATADFDLYLPTNTGVAYIHLVPATTVQYISEIATATNITIWGDFDSVRNTNGGVINFYYRASNTIGGVISKAWSSIVPGTTLSDPITNKFIQWASTINSHVVSDLSNIDNVTISYFQGSGNRNRPFATEWNREYWLSVATGTNNTSIQYVKAWNSNANPDAWNRLYNQDIRSFFKDGNSTLYAGSASSGTFYRLDYGTNDDGRAIMSYYETPDFTFDNRYQEKSLHEVWVDADRDSGKTFELGISTDNASMYFRNLSFSGTGRGIKTARGFFGTANTYRFRFQNTQLDKGLDLHSALFIYKNVNAMSPR
jgi:hypothetical protein